MAIAIFVDNVLRGAGNAPIHQGLALYRMFNQDVRVVLLCEDKAKTNTWLLQHRIKKVDDLMDYGVPGIGEDKDLDLIKYVRAQGKLDMVITGDIELAKKLLELGIDTLMFLHPTYLRPEFRPDGRQGVRSWAVIQEEMEKQDQMHLNDPRTKGF